MGDPRDLIARSPTANPWSAAGAAARYGVPGKQTQTQVVDQVTERDPMIMGEFNCTLAPKTPGCFLSVRQRDKLEQQRQLGITLDQVNYQAALGSVRVDELTKHEDDLMEFVGPLLALVGGMYQAGIMRVLGAIRSHAEREVAALEEVGADPGIVTRAAAGISDDVLVAPSMIAVSYGKEAVVSSIRAGADGKCSALTFIGLLTRHAPRVFEAMRRAVSATTTDLELATLYLASGIHEQADYETMIADQVKMFARLHLADLGRTTAPVPAALTGAFVETGTYERKLVWIVPVIPSRLRPKRLFLVSSVRDYQLPCGAQDYPTPDTQEIPTEFWDLALNLHMKHWGTPPEETKVPW